MLAYVCKSHQAYYYEAVDAFQTINRVAPCDRYAGIRAHTLTTLQNLGNLVLWKFVERHAHDRERQQRLPSCTRMCMNACMGTCTCVCPCHG